MKYAIAVALITGVISYHLGSNTLTSYSPEYMHLSQELNASETARDQLAEDYNVAMLNSNIPLGNLIHDTQFWCETETYLAREQKTVDQLPAEARAVCKTVDAIELYQDQNGDWYFDKSSGVNMEETK